MMCSSLHNTPEELLKFALHLRPFGLCCVHMLIGVVQCKCSLPHLDPRPSPLPRKYKKSKREMQGLLKGILYTRDKTLDVSEAHIYYRALREHHVNIMSRDTALYCVVP